jgi:hypothetical protein
MIFKVDHELHHADDFGFLFVSNKQVAQFVVAADLLHDIFCPSRRFPLLDKADDCGESFLPRLLSERQVADQVRVGKINFQLGVAHDRFLSFSIGLDTAC